MSAFVAACVGPNTTLGIVDPADQTAAVVAAANAVQVLPAMPAGRIIGPLDATSCKNVAWDPAPTRENALAQLKIKAARAGANAITALTYDDAGTSLWTNCWSSITARGTAVLIE